MSNTMNQIHQIRDLFYQQDKNISEIASETGFNWNPGKKYVDMEDFMHFMIILTVFPKTVDTDYER